MPETPSGIGIFKDADRRSGMLQGRGAYFHDPKRNAPEIIDPTRGSVASTEG